MEKLKKTPKNKLFAGFQFCDIIINETLGKNLLFKK